MDEPVVSTEQWLREELHFINDTMSHTLNGRMKAELVSCDDERQELVLRFPLLDWEINGLRTLHGGMASAMLDLTMSMVVYCYARQTIPPTITMTTNYLRPIPMEDYVHIRAKLTSLGKRNGTAYGEAIIPSTGKIASTAVATYAIVPKKP